MTNLIEKAKIFATEEHQRISHMRKYSNLPYQTHLQAVAKLVASVTDDQEMIAAAWLHDVVEDTPATLGDVEKKFHVAIAELVEELTDVSKPSDGNRAARKEIDRLHLAQASPRAKTIKLADLIHNCADIVKHDEKFAVTFLSEMQALLDVLQEGDAVLLKRAKKILLRSEEKLVVDKTKQRHIDPASRYFIKITGFEDQNFKDKFMALFSASDIAENLLSFDSDTLISKAQNALIYHKQTVASLRINGQVQGFIRLQDLKGEVCGDNMRYYTVDQVIKSSAKLNVVIHILTRHDYCFVTVKNEVTGFITRNDINKPQVRMWLFGLVTMIETTLMKMVEKFYPNNIWQKELSEGRLLKAQQIWQERQRRNVQCELIDCLQLTDKANILISNKNAYEMLGFESAKQAKKVIKEFESLRNHLAHAQDIVAYDWAQIARLVRRLDTNAE